MSAAAGLSISIFGGFVRFIAPQSQPIEGLGASVIALAIFAAGSMFRHSSVWIHFGILNAVFYGPAHHQIHHSAEERHRNRNLGASLSIWDHLFGTYYSPSARERFDYGLGSAPENAGYVSLKQLYLAPFIGLRSAVRVVAVGRLPGRAGRRARRLARAHPAARRQPDHRYSHISRRR
jgi:sterol desaturase/sphingolipid hydroxylase (fatty acid hydroxylase superfamily)